MARTWKKDYAVLLAQHMELRQQHDALDATLRALAVNPRDDLVIALQSIALSYPTTEEGETLAAIARDALAKAGVVS